MVEMSHCPLCQERVDPDLDNVPISTEHGVRAAHRECMLRTVMGGIGHLTNHAYWCSMMHDPDMGMSRRESAVMVDHWVRNNGVEAAAAVGSSGTGGGESAATDPRRPPGEVIRRCT